MLFQPFMPPLRMKKCCTNLLWYRNWCFLAQCSKDFKRSGSSAAAISKIEHFVIIINGWKLLTIITKCSILDAAVALDPLMFTACQLWASLSHTSWYLPAQSQQWKPVKSEWSHWYRSCVFMVNIKQIWRTIVVFPFLTLNFEQVNATSDVSKFIVICRDFAKAYSRLS